jgi:hypothetical protein
METRVRVTAFPTQVGSIHESQSKTWVSPDKDLRLARIHGMDSSSKVKWAIPQASAIRRLVSFQSDWSRADVFLSMDSCCLLESKVLLEKGSIVLKVILYGENGSGIHSHSSEAGFTQLWWIQGIISGTLTAVEVTKQ